MKQSSINYILCVFIFLISSFPIPTLAISDYYTLSKTARLIPYLNSENQDEKLFSLTIDLLNLVKAGEAYSQVKNGDIGQALMLLKEYQKLRGQTTFQKIVGYDLTENLPQKKLQEFKLQMLKVLETEAIIERQRIHFSALFEAVNNLKNPNEQILPIYIFSHKELPLIHSIEGELDALTIMAKAGDHYTSDTPSLRKYLPNLKKANNAISVHIVFNQPGKTLSHEFGHILYLYHNWERYQKFIKENRESHKFGGHMAGDPNGRAAELAERGIMPAVANIQ